jgi:hypothetical protein
MIRKFIFVLLIAQSAFAATVTFSLLPGNGSLGGAPGTTIGWGYTISNASPDYTLVSSLAFAGLPSFTIGTTQQLINQGTNNAFLAPPGDPLGLGLPMSLVSPFDGLGGGLLSLSIDPASMPGSFDAGNFQLTFHFLSPVDLSDDFSSPDIVLTQAFNANVISGAAPEPGTALLTAFVLVAILAVRRRSSLRRGRVA